MYRVKYYTSDRHENWTYHEREFRTLFFAKIFCSLRRLGKNECVIDS